MTKLSDGTNTSVSSSRASRRTMNNGNDAAPVTAAKANRSLAAPRYR